MAENTTVTAEYSTLLDLTNELRLAVRPELISLSGSLLALRLISPESEAKLRDTAAHSEVERSAKLVELVQKKVQLNPRHYHSFIGILQGNKDQYRDILQELNLQYTKHQDATRKDTVLQCAPATVIVICLTERMPFHV